MRCKISVRISVIDTQTFWSAANNVLIYLYFLFSGTECCLPSLLTVTITHTMCFLQTYHIKWPMLFLICWNRYFECNLLFRWYTSFPQSIPCVKTQKLFKESIWNYPWYECITRKTLQYTKFTVVLIMVSFELWNNINLYWIIFICIWCIMPSFVFDKLHWFCIL